MLFKNLTLLRFPANVDGLDSLETKLAEHPLKPVGALEMQSRGFVSPFGHGSDVMTHTIGRWTLINLGGEDKLLPAAVVNEELRERVEKHREEIGKSPSGKHRKEMKEAILHELMPRAFAKPMRLAACMRSDGWLVIDTTSANHVEALAKHLRQALGSFPAELLMSPHSARKMMTGWLAGDSLPSGWLLGDEVELKDPTDIRSVVKCKGVELRSDEVEQHLKSGKQAFAMQVVDQERVQFMLHEDFSLRRVKFLDGALDDLNLEGVDDNAAELDARFALMTAEFDRMLTTLQNTFAFE